MNGNSISVHTILSQYIRHIGAMSSASRSTTTQNVLPLCCGHLLAKDHGITDPIWNCRNKPTLLVIGKLSDGSIWFYMIYGLLESTYLCCIWSIDSHIVRYRRSQHLNVGHIFETNEVWTQTRSRVGTLVHLILGQNPSWWMDVYPIQVGFDPSPFNFWESPSMLGSVVVIIPFLNCCPEWIDIALTWRTCTAWMWVVLEQSTSLRDFMGTYIRNCDQYLLP